MPTTNDDTALCEAINRDLTRRVRELAGSGLDHVDARYTGAGEFRVHLGHGESHWEAHLIARTNPHWESEIQRGAIQVLQAETQRRLDSMRQGRGVLDPIPYQGQFLPPTEFTAEFSLSAQDFERFRGALATSILDPAPLPRDHRKKAAPKPNTRKVEPKRKTFWEVLLEED